MSVYIIAEAGVNHNGSVEIAKKLIEKAKDIGADCIKFQTFITENLVTTDAKKADYQVKNTKSETSQFEMLKKLELSFEQFAELKMYCEQIGIDFLSTAFDFDSIEFLTQLGMKFWKIPSGEITNLPYLERIGRTGMPVVLSTGMCDLKETEDAVNVLKSVGCKNIVIMHCTTEYPAKKEECNLRAMDTLKEAFGFPVGYSDHTEGILAPVIAVSRGAVMIEKHFTLDRSMEGPDHIASLDVEQFAEMVKQIRMTEKALGDGIKKPSEIEILNKKVARKSIVAKCDIKKGEIFTEDNLTVKRPGNGISPMRWHEILGTSSDRDYKKDELISV